MELSKWALKGSPSRDDFKMRHKCHLPRDCYAVDLDLVWVGRGRILAFFDYKRCQDSLNYNERVAYASLARLAPVLILFEVSSNKFDVFCVFECGRCSRIATGISWRWLAHLRAELNAMESLSNGCNETYLELAHKVLGSQKPEGRSEKERASGMLDKRDLLCYNCGCRSETAEGQG